MTFKSRCFSNEMQQSETYIGNIFVNVRNKKTNKFLMSSNPFVVETEHNTTCCNDDIYL